MGSDDEVERYPEEREPEEDETAGSEGGGPGRRTPDDKDEPGADQDEDDAWSRVDRDST